MTKKDLIEAIRTQIDAKGDGPVHRIAIEMALEGLASAIGAELAKGGEVPLPGIGKLSVKEHAAREGRNPATGEAITIPAGKKVHFSAAKALKNAVA